MKEHAKKALKHDFKVAGKTVPTLAIVALFLVGTGSAALLTSFGTVSGEADVTQSIQIDSSVDDGSLTEGTADLSFGFNSPTAGTTTVDTFTIENNMDRSYPVEFASYTGTTSIGDSADETSPQFKWAGSSDSYGIRTTYANYFPDSGATLTDESGGSAEAVVGSGGSFSTIQGAIDDSSIGSGDTIFVEAGTYTEDLTFNKDVDLVGAGAEDVTLEGRVVFQKAGDSSATPELRGFTVENQNATSAIKVQDSEPTVILENNRITDAGSYNNLLVEITGSSEVQVMNNELKDGLVGVLYAEGNQPKVTVTGNTITGMVDTNADYDSGAALKVSGGQTTDTDITFESNVVTGNDRGFYLEDTGGTHTISISQNRFDNQIDLHNKEADYTLTANNNFFSQGTWGEVNNGNIEGDVTASYETVDSIPADSEVEVAAVNEFALMLEGSSYSLATAIQ